MDIDINAMLNGIAERREAPFVLGRHKIGDDVEYHIAPQYVQKQFAIMQSVVPKQLAIQRSIMNKIGWDFVLVDLQTFAIQPFPIAAAPDTELGNLLDANGNLKPEVEREFALGG